MTERKEKREALILESRVTLYYPNRTLRRVEGDAINIYSDTTDRNWNCPRKARNL